MISVQSLTPFGAGKFSKVHSPAFDCNKSRRADPLNYGGYKKSAIGGLILGGLSGLN